MHTLWQSLLLLTVKSECLDHFIVCGEQHLRYLLNEFTETWYNEVRPHQGVGSVPLAKDYQSPPPQPIARAKEVRCQQRLGGLLKHYSLRAAA
jgi:putative transposase